MDAETTLVAILRSNAEVARLVSDRIYADIMPATCRFPCLVYQQVSSERERALASVPGIEIARYGLDVWSNDHQEARAVMRAVRLALDGYNARQGEAQLSIGVMAQRLDWDDAAAYYHGILEVTVQHDEEVPA